MIREGRVYVEDNHDNDLVSRVERVLKYNYQEKYLGSLTILQKIDDTFLRMASIRNDIASI